MADNHCNCCPRSTSNTTTGTPDPSPLAAGGTDSAAQMEVKALRLKADAAEQLADLLTVQVASLRATLEMLADIVGACPDHGKPCPAHLLERVRAMVDEWERTRRAARRYYVRGTAYKRLRTRFKALLARTVGNH